MNSTNPMEIHEALIHTFYQDGYDPDPRDIRTQAFSQAMFALADNPDVKGALLDAIWLRTQRGVANRPSQLASHVLRSIQLPLLTRREETGYPELFDNSEVWKDNIHWLFTDKARYEENLTLREQIVNKTGLFPLVSNKYERYAGVAFLMNIFPDLLPPEPQVDDFGTSQMQGPKALASNEPFDPILILQREGGPIDAELTEKFNKVINHRRRLGRSLCVDEMTPSVFLGLEAFAECCSFYPTEHMNTRLIERYRRIGAVSLCNLEFVEANLRKPGLKLRHGQLADVTILATMLNQLVEEDDMTVLATADANTSETGFVVVEEFGHVEPTAPNTIICDDDWFGKPFIYKMFVKEKRRAELGLQHFLSWREPRCKVAAFGNSPLANEAKERLLAA